MKKRFWQGVGLLLAIFLLLGVVQTIRHPDYLNEAWHIIAVPELNEESESQAP